MRETAQAVFIWLSTTFPDKQCMLMLKHYQHCLYQHKISNAIRSTLHRIKVTLIQWQDKINEILHISQKDIQRHLSAFFSLAWIKLVQSIMRRNAVYKHTFSTMTLPHHKDKVQLWVQAYASMLTTYARQEGQHPLTGQCAPPISDGT